MTQHSHSEMCKASVYNIKNYFKIVKIIRCTIKKMEFIEDVLSRLHYPKVNILIDSYDQYNFLTLTKFPICPQGVSHHPQPPRSVHPTCHLYPFHLHTLVCILHWFVTWPHFMCRYTLSGLATLSKLLHSSY